MVNMDNLEEKLVDPCGNCSICKKLIPENHVKVLCQSFCIEKTENSVLLDGMKYHEWHLVGQDKSLKFLCNNCGRTQFGESKDNQANQNNIRNNSLSNSISKL